MSGRAGSCSAPTPRTRASAVQRRPSAAVSAQREQSYAPRLAAALRIALPLFDHVWLDGIASYTYSPLGHVAAFPSIDKVAGPPDELAKRALPGEPSGALQLGIGLRIGAP